MALCPVFPPHAPQYGAVDTYRLAAAWLDGHGDVYDWGCGGRFAEQFFARSRYVGIDGNAGDDLAQVQLDCDSILMRHILENNPERWCEILDNALRSFRRRMTLVMFTAFADTTHVYKTEQYESGPLSYLRFRKRDLTDLMGPLLVQEQSVLTTHPEHIFYLERA
jgi:hypothetical protein